MVIGLYEEKNSVYTIFLILLKKKKDIGGEKHDI